MNPDISSLSLKVEPSIIDIGSDSETSDTEAEPTAVQPEKRQLARELKALGLDMKKFQKPDYTKVLNEPSWGDEEDGEDEEYVYEEPVEDRLEILEYEEMELGGGNGEDIVGEEEGSEVEMK
jgi:hypothetical protein